MARLLAVSSRQVAAILAALCALASIAAAINIAGSTNQQLHLSADAALATEASQSTPMSPATQAEWDSLFALLERFSGIPALSSMPLSTPADSHSSFLAIAARQYAAARGEGEGEGEGAPAGGDKAAEEKPEPCPGLDMCNPCYNQEPQLPQCPQWMQTCKRLFCAPLCLRLLWEVKVRPIGGSAAFKKELSEGVVPRALEGYLMTHGCQDLFSCCEKGDRMTNWLERHVFQGNFPHPAAVTECRGEEDKAKALAKCQGNIEIKVVPIKGACDKFVKPMEPTDYPGAGEAFKRAGMEAESETPKHRSFKERCEELQKQIEEKASEWEAKFTKVACACVGCDDAKKCPNYVAYDSLPRALKEDFNATFQDYGLTIGTQPGASGGAAAGGAAAGGAPKATLMETDAEYEVDEEADVDADADEEGEADADADADAEGEADVEFEADVDAETEAEEESF